VLVNQTMRQLPWAWRRWQVFGWWLVAGVAGAATVAVTGALLRWESNGWLVWVLVVVAGWLIGKVEDLLTVWRYRERIPRRPADQQEALRRAREWRELRPGDTSAMPWLYAYSGRTTEQLMEDFQGLGTSGPVGFTSKLLGLVTIVLFYSLLPAPDVSRFADEGLAGCFFGIVHGFAGVAQENLGLSIVGAVVLLVLMPVSVLVAYLRFTMRYHFPAAATAQVLVRESRFALVMPLFSIVMIAVFGFVIALLMWGSAATADAWDSPVAGTLLLTVPVILIVWRLSKTKVRGPLPR
jgi:hypothetical protein